MKQKNKIKRNSPIIIGGFGGSGTRVIAEILKSCDYNIGIDINKANDDLSFTFFFKTPKIFTNIKKINKNKKEISKLFKIHYKINLGINLTLIDKIKIIKIGIYHIFFNNYYNNRWVIKRFLRFLKKKKITESIKWSFKEPHTIYFLERFITFYDNPKFILVLRNGLDMAYTKTDQQFLYWGDFFKKRHNKINTPKDKFNYWYEFNVYAKNILRKYYRDNYLIVKYEDLVFSPEENVKMILRFLEVKNYDINKLIKIIQIPSSINRFKEYNSSWIDDEVKNKLSELEYKIEINK